MIDRRGWSGSTRRWAGGAGLVLFVLLHAGCGSTLAVQQELATKMALDCEEEAQQYLQTLHSFPAFLSAVTLRLFNSQTVNI